MFILLKIQIYIVMRYTDILLFIANVLVKLCFILVTEIVLLILGQCKIT